MTTSIRDLLVLIGVFALALSSIRVGGLLASTTVFLVWLIALLRLLVAVLGKPEEQVAARGFAISVFLYVLSLTLLGSTEFGTLNPRLFTSQILAQLKAGAFSGVTNSPTWEMMSVGHALIAMALGMLGSFFATSLQDNNKPKKTLGEPSDELKSPRP